MHGAVFAVAAIAYNGFTAAFFSYHIDDDRGDDAEQYSTDHYCPDVFGYPLEHKLNSLFKLFCQFACFLIGLEEHEQHAGDKQDGNHQADNIKASGEGAADLVDAEGDCISKAALIEDSKRRPFC